MSTKPQQRPNSQDGVMLWIAQYQKSESDEAQTKLVDHYKSLVQTLSRKFAKGPEHAEDLYQVGMLGLLGAIRRFDPTVGKSFESFAVPTVIGEIKRYIRDKTWSVHVPRRIKELGPKIKKAVDELTNEYQRSPKVEEIAELIGVSVEEVLEAMEMGRSYQALSVDRPIEADQEGGEATLLDLVGRPEEGYEQTDHQILLEKAFVVLSERERQILQLTYYENLSQKETGEQLGISQMHVSRLQRRALQKLRETIDVKPTECLK
ncbi:MAG: RNA polymerase sigma factor SigB [Bacillaceae bacterium]|uniref:RNA polymerase sigma factor SigB n=1 Tax=Alkalihalobacterium chitinilyticum TaxID=2980103 RepID=A0ABT5VKV1_9BACI|nr:RNA polymerase sigma factor SigB [Alkalihalobacterium chitinilyticum]MDE5416077.1 RNA polymerase sigma factor SigB [Alkalihalobacterium chitinilyticum]MEB1805783.1 RNA polymerase sigma factor SigB [Bacillaceae bacterium]